MIRIGTISAVKRLTEFIWICKDLIVRWPSRQAFLVITFSFRQLIRRMIRTISHIQLVIQGEDSQC